MTYSPWPPTALFIAEIMLLVVAVLLVIYAVQRWRNPERYGGQNE